MHGTYPWVLPFIHIHSILLNRLIGSRTIKATACVRVWATRQGMNDKAAQSESSGVWMIAVNLLDEMLSVHCAHQSVTRHEDFLTTAQAQLLGPA